MLSMTRKVNLDTRDHGPGMKNSGAGRLTHCGGEIWVDPDYVGGMWAVWRGPGRAKTGRDRGGAVYRAVYLVVYNRCPHISAHFYRYDTCIAVHLRVFHFQSTDTLLAIAAPIFYLGHALPPRNSFEMGTDNGEKSLSKRDKIIKIIISCVSRVSCCLLFQFDDSRRALFLVQIFRIMMLRCYDVDEDWKNSYLCINIRTLIIYIYIYIAIFIVKRIE